MSRSRKLYERQCFELGYKLVAGVDEVGVGCLAGPVVAAAVIFCPDSIPRGIDDSKLLTPAQREKYDTVIRKRAVAFSVGVAEVEEIDTLNIYQASRLAMLRAVRSLLPNPEFVLLDGRGKLDCALPQKAIVKGDHLSVTIGAASILAKVYRDRLMRELDTAYPGYEFAKHKGYGSVLHRRCIQSLGPSPIHRKSFHWKAV